MMNRDDAEGGTDAEGGVGDASETATATTGIHASQTSIVTCICIYHSTLHLTSARVDHRRSHRDHRQTSHRRDALRGAHHEEAHHLP